MTQDQTLSPGIRVLATVSVVLALIGIAALLVLFGAIALWPPVLAVAVADLPGGAAAETLAPWSRAAVLALAALSLLPPIWALWHTAALFLRLRRGTVLTSENARHLRRIGQAAILAALAGAAARAAAGVVMSMAAGQGQGGTLALSIGSGGFAMVLFGAMLIVLGAVMGDAARIADDHRQIV